MANQPPTNKNTIQNATVTAGGNIHIGDIYNPNSPPEPEKPKNTKGSKAKTTAKDFEPEIRDSLKKRYQKRLDQKMAGRLPINLRRIDFSESAAQIAQKQFKEIAPGDVEAELTEFFKIAEGRLLVVGAPGAGKTTLLLQLAMGLLETQADVLPAVVNLATWSSEFKTLDEWLKKILPVELDVSTASAVRLLAESRVVLLFDGLDEIPDAEQRAACLAAIDLFVSPVRPRREFAISSRTKEFREAGWVPLVSFPIEVGALTMEQIERELTRRDPAQPEDRDLLAALRNDQYLREAAETPFYFNCLQLLFGEGKRPVFSAGDQEGREKEVLDAFVGNELGKCTKPETQKWVSFLAKRMSERDLVRFELRDLQYNWCDWSRWETVVIRISSMLSVHIFLGLFIMLVLPTLLFCIIGFTQLAIYYLIFLLLFYVLNITLDTNIETKDERNWSLNKLIWYYKKVFVFGLFWSFLLGLMFPISFFFVGLIMDIDFSIDLWILIRSITLFSIFIQVLILVAAGLVMLEEGHTVTLKISYSYQRFYSSMLSFHFSIIQHFHLRYQISQKSLLPFSLVHFLNEMSSYEPKLEKWENDNEKRKKAGKSEKPRPARPSIFTKYPVHLMESDGASWCFRHRFIQEWFAEKWQEEQPKN
jgi:DNA replication protein DnaC